MLGIWSRVGEIVQSVSEGWSYLYVGEKLWDMAQKNSFHTILRQVMVRTQIFEHLKISCFS